MKIMGIDLGKARTGVCVSDLSGFLAGRSITIAEHMICVLLMMMRRMPEYQALIAKRGWEIIGDIRSIYDSTVTIVGMGDIGSNFGRRLKAMGATVRGVRRTQQPKPEWCDEVYTIDQLQEAVKGADVVADKALDIFLPRNIRKQYLEVSPDQRM